MLGDRMDAYTIFASGSTPDAAAGKIEATASHLDRETAMDFTGLLLLAAIGNPRLITDFLSDHASVSRYVRSNFMLNNSLNFTSLRVAGHSYISAVGPTVNPLIANFRAIIKGQNIWIAYLNTAAISDEQQRIYLERKARTSLESAVAGGRRIINSLMPAAAAAEFYNMPPMNPEGGHDVPMRGDGDENTEEKAAGPLKKVLRKMKSRAGGSPVSPTPTP